MSASLAPKTSETIQRDLGTPAKEWAANTQNALFDTTPIHTTTNSAAHNPTADLAAENTATTTGGIHPNAIPSIPPDAPQGGTQSNAVTPGHEMPGGWGQNKPAEGSQLYTDVTNTITSIGNSALNAIQPILPGSMKSGGQQSQQQPSTKADTTTGGVLKSGKKTWEGAKGLLPSHPRKDISHRGGVGDLPGNDSEVSVVKLPEERAHPDPYLEPYAKETFYTGGAGDLPGSADESGVARLPEERANPDPLAPHGGKDKKQMVAEGVAGGAGAAAVASDHPKGGTSPKQVLKNFGDKITRRSNKSGSSSDHHNISSPVSSHPITESEGVTGSSKGFGGPQTGVVAGQAFTEHGPDAVTKTEGTGFDAPRAADTTSSGFDASGGPTVRTTGTGLETTAGTKPKGTGRGVDRLMGRHGTKGEKEIDSHIINTTGVDHVTPHHEGADVTSAPAVTSGSPADEGGAKSPPSSPTSPTSPSRTKVPLKDRFKGEMKIISGKLTHDPVKVEEGKVLMGQSPPASSP